VRFPDEIDIIATEIFEDLRLALAKQRRIVTEAEVDASKGLQTETAAALDALLDKAFKGEL